MPHPYYKANEQTKRERRHIATPSPKPAGSAFGLPHGMRDLSPFSVLLVAAASAPMVPVPALAVASAPCWCRCPAAAASCPLAASCTPAAAASFCCCCCCHWFSLAAAAAASCPPAAAVSSGQWIATGRQIGHPNRASLIALAKRARPGNNTIREIEYCIGSRETGQCTTPQAWISIRPANADRRCLGGELEFAFGLARPDCTFIFSLFFILLYFFVLSFL